MAHVHPSKFRAMPEVRQQVLREELQGVAVTHLHILKNHRAIVQAFRLACSWGPALAEGNVGLNGWMSFCARVNLYYPAPEDAGRSAETVTDLHMTVNADSTPEEQREVEEMLASIRHRQADLVKQKATKIIPTWRETEEPKVGRYNRRLSIGAGSQKRRMESVSAMHNMVLALNGVGDDLVQEKPTLDSEYLEAAFAFAARGVERIGMQDFTVLLVVTAAQAYPHIASDDPEAAVRKLLHEFVTPAVSDLCPDSADDIFARSPVRLFPDVSTVVELFREVFRGAFIALRDLVTHKIPFDILASFFAQIGVHKAGHFTEASLRQAYCDAGQTTWSAAPDAIELERFIDVSIFVAFQLYGMEPHKSSLPTIAGRLYVFMMTWQQWYRRKLGRNVEADKVHPQPDDPRITRMSTVVVDATMAHQIEIMGKNFSDRQMYFRFGDLVTMTRQLHDGTAVVEVPPATTNAIEIRLTERDEDYFVAVVHVKRVQVTASITGDHFSPPHSRDFVYQNVLPATSLSQFQGQLYRVWQNYSQIKDTNNFVLLKYSQWKRLLQDFKLLPTDDEVRKALEEHHRIAEEQKREQELHTISIRRTSNSQVQPAVPHSRGGASRASKGSIDMGRVKMASRGSDVSSRQTVTFGTLGTTSPASPASPASPTLSDPSGAFSEHSDVRGLLPPALAETLLNTAVTHTGAAVTDDLKAMKQREQQMKLVFSLHAQSCRMAPNGLLVNPNSAEAVHEGLAKPRSDKRKSGRSRSQFSFSSVALARKQSIAGAASSSTSPTRSHSTFGQELFGGSTAGKPPLANGSPSPPAKPDPALDLFDHEEEPDSDEETNDRSKWISVEGLSFEHFLKAICHALVLHRGSVVDGLNDMLSADLWVGRELLEDVASNNRGALSLRIRRAAHQLKIDSALQNVEHLPSPRRPSDPSAEEETREFLEAELGPYVPAGRWLNAEAHDRQLVSFVMTERQREEDYRTRAAEAMKRFETAPRTLDIDAESAEPFHNQGKAGDKKPATAEERAAIVKKELGRMLMHTQRDTYGLALRTHENKSRQQALQMDRLKSELEAQKARADAAEAKLQKGAQMGNHVYHDGTFDGDSVGGRGVLRAEKQELQRLFIQQVERKKHQLEAAHRDQENLRDIERDRVVGELQQQMQVADLCFRRMQDTVKAQTDMLRKEADVTLTLRKRIDTLMEDSTFFRQATERLFGVVEKGKHRDLVDELETARQAHEEAMLELTQEMFSGAHDAAKATSPTQSPRTGGPKSARKSVVRPVRRSEVSIRSDREHKPGAPGGRRSIAELVEQGNSMIATPNGFVLPDVPVITTHYTTDEVNEIKRRLEDELERKGEAQTTAMEKKAKAAEMALSAKIEHLQAEVRLAQASAQARQEALQQRQRQSSELQAELTTTVKGLEDRVSTASKNAANAEAELAKRKEAADKLSDEVSALRTITQELEEQVERQAEALEAEEAKRVAAEDALHTQTLRQSRERAEALRSRSDHGTDDEEISTEPSDEASYETDESEEDFDSEEVEESDDEEDEEGEPGVDANNETRRGSGPLASTDGHVEPNDGVGAAPPKPISKRTKATTRRKPKTKPRSSKALLTPQSSRDVNSSRRRQRKPIGRQGSPSQARKHRGSEEASRTPSPARRTKSGGGGGSDRPMGSNADTSSMDMVAVRVDTAEGVFPHPAPAEVRSDIETPAAHPPGSTPLNADGAAAGSPDGQGTGHVPRKANRRRKDKRSKSPRPTGDVKGSGSREAFTGHVFSDDEEYDEEYGELLGEADAFEVHEMVKLHTGADVSIVKHTLKFGDTLQDIARLYGVPIEAVLRRNFIAAPELPEGCGSLAEVPAEELRFLLDDANLVVHGIPSKMLSIPVRTGTPGAMAAMSPDRRLDGGFLKRKATPQPTPGFSPAAHSAVISHSIISGVAALPPAPADVVAQETLPPMDESKHSLPADHDEKTGEEKIGEDKDEDDAEGETPIGDSQRRPTVIPQPSLPRDNVDSASDTARVLVLQQQQAVQQQAAQQQQVQVRALATEASTLKQELQMLKAAVATMTSAAMSQTDGQLPKLEALIAKVAEQSQPPPPPPPSGLPPDLPPRAVGTPSQGTRPRSRQAMTPDNIGGSRSKVVSRGSDTGSLGAVRPPRPAEAIDDDGRPVVVGASETDTGSPRQAPTPRSSRVMSPVETAAAAEVSQPVPVGDPDQVPRARGSTPSRGLRRQTPKQKAEHLEAEAGEFTAAPQIAVAATMDAPVDDDRAVTFVAKRLSDASSLQSGSAQGLAPSFPQLQDLDGTGSRGAVPKVQNQNTLGVIPIETFFSTSDLHESRRPSVAPVGALANSSISGFGTTGEMGVWAAGARPAEPPRGDVIETPQKTKARPGGVPPKPQGSRLIPMTLASLVVADEAAAPQPLGARSMPGKGLLFVSATKVGSKVDSGAQTLVMDRVASRMAQHEEAARLQVMLLEHRTLEALVAAFNHTGDHLMGTHGTLSSGGGLRTASRSPDRDLMDDTVGGASPSHLQQQMTSTGERHRRGSLFQGPAFAGTGGSTVDDLKPPEGMVGATATLHDQGASRAAARAERVAQRQTELQAQRAAEVRRRFDATAERLAAAERNAAHGARLRKFTTDQLRRGRRDDAAALAAKVKQQRAQRGTLQSKLPPLAATPEPRDRSRSTNVDRPAGFLTPDPADPSRKSGLLSPLRSTPPAAGAVDASPSLTGHARGGGRPGHHHHQRGSNSLVSPVKFKDPPSAVPPHEAFSDEQEAQLLALANAEEFLKNKRLGVSVGRTLSTPIGADLGEFGTV